MLQPPDFSPTACFAQLADHPRHTSAYPFVPECTHVYLSVPKCTGVYPGGPQYSPLLCLLTILGQPDLLRLPSPPSQMRAVNHNPHKWSLYCSKAGTVRA